jgi:PKD repeat protein
VTHTYEKSGTFDVKLTVSDKDNNSNTYTRTVYVSESDKPLAFIDISLSGLEKPQYDVNACEGTGGYIVDRVDTLNFDGAESINIDGDTAGLEYSWKIGNGKFSTAGSLSHRFDEIGCFPVKLTVKSDKNNAVSSREVYMDVRNALPTMSALKVEVDDPTTDPLIVRVDALGATDPDGVIQSYLWYYYTDTDTQPQDFRSTATPATAFVIPKITGNYYFVAILKDNNEAKVTSEEVTGARYFTTITGDNINTPIVELSVNDNSAIIGEEIVFTAKAKNILGQQIEKDASFSWDFDGDGFYDTQTTDATTTYKYRKSGEFYAKVKVKYKGISSTKNITMNVSNKLIADFDYISIGNKFIFFDTSSGQVDARSWDLGDGTKKSGTYFEHTYTDGQVSHDITLNITEGSKTKEIKKTVSKNIKNILKTRGSNLVVFTSPTVEDGKVVLENESERFFVYLGESDPATTIYAIDYDIENDSDLNGGADDDEDNKGTASYISGDVAEIPLGDYKMQNIRIFTKDADGNVLGTQDIQIEQSYIEEQNIDPDTIVFE